MNQLINTVLTLSFLFKEIPQTKIRENQIKSEINERNKISSIKEIRQREEEKHSKEISEKKNLKNYGFSSIYKQESEQIQFNVEVLNKYVQSEL